MKLRKYRPAIARLIVATLGAGFIQVSFSAPAAQASTPIKPTISSITSGASSLTVNMVTTGITATQWRWSITRRVASCALPVTDGAVQSTVSISPTIQINSLTAGCTYSIRVAGFNNNVIGEFAESSKLVGGYSSVLNLVVAADGTNVGAGMNRLPISSGCHIGTAATINIPSTSSAFGSCASTNFTGYYSGYIRAPFTGTVTFRTNADDFATLAIQGNTVIRVGGSTGTFSMVLGQVYRFEQWFHNDGGPYSVATFWSYTGQPEQVIPAGSFANDPSVLASDGGCSIGMAPRCAAGSAMEIKLATGTNVDGQYWIEIGGVPTLVYSIMNSSQGGGGWMLAMRGRNNATTFQYNSAFWTNSTLLNSAYPQRLRAEDPVGTINNTDAKYEPFTSSNSNQVMVLYPEITTIAGGAFGTNGSSNPSGINGSSYGFAWHETFTAGSVWTAYNSTTKWGGNSHNISHTGGPTNTPTCVNSASTLTNLFSNASRCAFRRVNSNYVPSESPYSAVGNNLFFSQTNVRFFGINYGNASTSFASKARIGFGWNENGPGEETSNDGNGGIGLFSTNSNTLGAGTFNGCCSATVNAADANIPGQTGISGGDNTTRHLGFELYVRNSNTTQIFGNNLRVVSKRSNSLTSGNTFTAPATNGSNTFRLSPAREDIFINPSTGVVTVSESLPVGDYTSTLSVTDTNGVTGIRSFVVQVLSESRETDTALSFNGTSQFVSTTGNYGLWGDQTHSAWVRADSSCSGNTSNSVAVANGTFRLYCRNSFWFFGFQDISNVFSVVQTSQRVVSGAWVHIAVVRSGSTVTAFINNSQALLLSGSTYVSSVTQSSIRNIFTSHFVGGSGAAGEFFTGVVDEVKVWDSARTINQIWDGANSQENVGQANLLIYWDFNEGTGSAISRSQRVDNNFSLTPQSSAQWVSVVQTAQSGPYTVVTVPRTVISFIGGWRVPATVTTATTIVVGGGGGSGKSTSSSQNPAGSGGGGGVSYVALQSLTPGTSLPIRVGTGGIGAVTIANDASNRNGTSTTLGVSGGITALGGGGGGSNNQPGAGGSTIATGGGGGGNPSSTSCAVLGPAGGVVDSGFNGARGGWGWGGPGGSARGAAQDASNTVGCFGITAPGFVDSITNIEYGRSGSNQLFADWNPNSNYTRASNGWGGSVSYGAGAVSNGDGLSGSGGVVIFRFITNVKPAFTQPTNTTINVGMTETFTVNVALDSATVGLTRTFRWESSTTGSNGTFSTIKQGTGAANAFFAWVPPDTATSGSNFVFRVIVTDSDTVGLFIQETSTAVFATINRALLFAGKDLISKTVGVSKSETFTVLHGTPSYRYTLVPDSPFFWLDTVTATTPRLRIADTATVGTYFETITVIDSISAAVSIPLTIKVSPPPSFSANAEQVDSGTVLFLDAGNSASFPRTGTAWNDLSGRGLSGNLTANLGSRLAGSTINTCVAPGYTTDGNGSFNFISANRTCAYIPDVNTQVAYTVDTWIKRSGPQTPYSAILTTPYSGPGQQINIALHWVTSTDLIAGIYTGSAWIYSAQVLIPDNTWSNAVVTFTGSALTLIVNNVATTPTTGINVSWQAAKLDTGILMGRKWDANADWMTTSVATVRIYNRALSSAELSQNYAATRGRFEGTVNKRNPLGKYGTTVNETITVTAGSETLTATFTSAAIAGLLWDTSTVRSLRVQLQDSLSAGTYLDTVTVTDIYGSSSNFPLTFTVGRADTITVIVDTPTALSYTGSIANFTPTVRVTGLVSSDTGTAVSSISYKPGGLTCATGGTCAIGDIGPGGGIVFITPATVGGNGRFFEAAPANWAGTDDISTAAKFCTGATNQDNVSRAATQFGIGWGETNTALFEPHCTGGAVKLVSDYTGGGFTNWFIPNSNELIELAKVREAAGLLQLGSGWSSGRFGYWGSTEESAGVMRTLISVNDAWNIGSTNKNDATNNMVRPVRMFTPCWGVDTCTSLSTTTRPTDAGTYSILPAGLSLTQGNLANYQAIRYQSSTVTINRVAQRAIELPFYSPTYPETLTIFFGGGSGTGAVRFVVTNGGSATGCAADYRKISTTSVGTCQVQVVKAGDRNHFTETTTAAINFIQFVLTQLAPTVGSGATIALNGINSVTVDADYAPTISSLSSNSGAIGATITINGAGFFFANPSLVEIKFSRSVLATTFTLVSDSVITVTVPVGAITAPILVVTPHGAARSATFTVLP